MRFFQNLIDKFSGKPVDWDELEETLVRADLGIPMTTEIIDALHERGEVNARLVAEVTREHIMQILPMENPAIRPLPHKPKVLLIVGVNGTGKTTSAAKLANFFHNNRHSVLLVAADTFRAAAIEQLEIWADRIGVEIFKSEYGADPAAVCHDAYAVAARKNIEFVICDTAGRLHTRANLMNELEKIRRAIRKQDEKAPQETLLVVDATTGTNALTQAQVFHESTPLTGAIITKLDGSGKGGIVVAIQKEYNIAPRFIGTGETLNDFTPFEREEFAANIL